MPILHHDYETRSTLNLRDVGAWRYASDPTTDVLCASFAVDGGPVKSWTRGEPIPQEFFEAAHDPDWLLAAHNDNFERSIEERLLGPRYGWPLVPIERRRCTMAMALAIALPGSLAGAAAALGLSIQKDEAGARLMRQMCKPRKPRKGEDPNAVWVEDPVHLERLKLYCENDVAVERELHHRLPPLSEVEQRLWELDARINARGFHVDVPLAEAAQRIVDQTLAAINAELAELTDGRITSISQVTRLTALLREHGHDVKSAAKRSISAVLAHNPSDQIRRILELRQTGGRASAGKLDALLRSENGGRLHGTLKYHGAATGRWSGQGFQPHNLVRAQPEDLDAAIAAVASGDLDRATALGPPLDVVSTLSRAMIYAAPDKVLISADYSAIESRVLAWLAGEKWKLQNYLDFDRTGDPRLEPYCVTATRMLHREITPADEVGRQHGKTADLALGFGGSVGAWRRFLPDDPRSDEQIVQETVKPWRDAHPAIVRYWGSLHRALLRAARTHAPIGFNNLQAEMRGDNLYLRLPSGRELVYPNARILAGEYSDEIVFMDSAFGGWKEARGWHGIFVENVVSAISRDLLVNAMPKLETAGYPIILHVHDEIVAEVNERFGSPEEFASIMTELPTWATGLPLVAKGARRQRYAKEKKKTEAPVHEPLPDDLTIPGFLQRVSIPPAASRVHIMAASGITVTPIIASPSLVPIEPLTETIEEFRPLEGAHDAAPRNRTPEPETLDECLARIPLPDLVGEEGKVSCPFHDDGTPSCHIYSDHYRCFGCGAHGRHLDWLRKAEKKSEDEAFEILINWQGPAATPRHEAAVEWKRELALELWNESKPIAGTLAERYLAEVRGIDIAALPTDNAALRFHPSCPFGKDKYAPCLVALFRDIATDEPVGIHRIALTPDVFAGKKVERKMLGTRTGTSAIKLWPTIDQLFVGEGIETALAAATRMSYCGTPMRPAWAAGSADAFKKFPIVAGVRRLVILADHDFDGHSANCAGECIQRWRDAGLEVALLKPPVPGTDFNNFVLQELLRNS